MNEEKIPYTFGEYDHSKYELYYQNQRLSGICKVTTTKGYEFLVADLAGVTKWQESGTFLMQIFIHNPKELYLKSINN